MLSITEFARRWDVPMAHVESERSGPAVLALRREEGLLAEPWEVRFRVAAVDPALDVEVDLPLLSFALSHLVERGFLNARKGASVTLRTRGGQGRVFLEVEEPRGDVPDPARAGLPIFRMAVTSLGGQVPAQDQPVEDFIFELERSGVAQAV
jgi:hypothetical protein